MTRTGTAAVVATFGIGLTLAAVQMLAQDAGENGFSRRIEGTWAVQITPRDCQTGIEFTDLTHPGLNTFFAGGAMISNPATSPALLRTGHGVWSHAGGDRFLNTVRSFVFTPQGVLMGTVVVTREIVLSPDRASYTAADVAELRDLQWNQVGPTRCAVNIGSRLD